MIWRTFSLGMASGALILPAKALPTEATSYCVRPIETVRLDTKEPFSQSTGPSKLLYADEAETPFAVDNVREPAEGDRYYLRMVHWRFTADYRLEGPIDVSQHGSVGTDGKLAYFFENHGVYGRVEDEDDADADAEDRIWSLAPDGKMQVVEGPWTGNGWSLAFEQPAATTGKLVLQAWSEDQRRSGHKGYFALKDGRVEVLGVDRPFLPNKVFPKHKLSVEVARSGFTLGIPGTEMREELSLPHTEDFGWWESFNIDRYGWLFAEGYGNDYAVKLRPGDDLEVERIHRFTGRGWFGRLIEWIFGFGPGSEIASTQVSSQCVDFSPVLGLTLFCKPAKVLRDGRLKDLPDPTTSFDRYLGDATASRVALIKRKDKGKLFAFDGEAVLKLPEDFGEAIKVQDLPQSGRTFITGTNGIHELTGTFPDLRVHSISVPNPKIEALRGPGPVSETVRWMRFMEFPGSRDVLGIARSGAWRVGPSEIEPIWQASEAPIWTREIAPIAAWSGLLFLTANNKANLITECAD